MMAAAGLIWTAGCGGPGRLPPGEPHRKPRLSLPQLHYTLQAGAFRNIDNAVRLTAKLISQRQMAYHFIDDSGFYKVRIGNFPSRQDALETAERLVAEGVIEEYFLVTPDDHPAARFEADDESRLRREIIRTAERFIGVPYRWGGESSVSGFDCSGLTMVVYQLNGLDLPRTSAEQYSAGRSVDDGDLAAGDLVFFATARGSRVSHVGIYIGDGRFLHAPGRGSRIEVASLFSDYFRPRYLGARSYL
jgi:cell wall-associated NlpC family hydrolase